jgi:hypothetical protein
MIRDSQRQLKVSAIQNHRNPDFLTHRIVSIGTENLPAPRADCEWDRFTNYLLFGKCMKVKHGSQMESFIDKRTIQQLLLSPVSRFRLWSGLQQHRYDMRRWSELQIELILTGKCLQCDRHRTSPPPERHVSKGALPPC